MTFFWIHAERLKLDAPNLEDAIAAGRQAAAAGARGVAVTKKTLAGEKPVWAIWKDEGGRFRETRTPRYVEEVRRFALLGRGALPS